MWPRESAGVQEPSSRQAEMLNICPEWLQGFWGHCCRWVIKRLEADRAHDCSAKKSWTHLAREGQDLLLSASASFTQPYCGPCGCLDLVASVARVHTVVIRLPGLAKVCCPFCLAASCKVSAHFSLVPMITCYTYMHPGTHCPADLHIATGYRLTPESCSLRSADASGGPAVISAQQGCTGAVRHHHCPHGACRLGLRAAPPAAFSHSAHLGRGQRIQLHMAGHSSALLW